VDSHNHFGSNFQAGMGRGVSYRCNLWQSRWIRCSQDLCGPGWGTSCAACLADGLVTAELSVCGYVVASISALLMDFLIFLRGEQEPRRRAGGVGLWDVCGNPLMDQGHQSFGVPAYMQTRASQRRARCWLVVDSQSLS